MISRSHSIGEMLVSQQ